MLLPLLFLSQKTDEYKRINELLKNAERTSDTENIEKYKKELRRISSWFLIA